VIAFGIFVAAGLVEGEWGQLRSKKWTPAQWRKLLPIGLASGAALFINPFGYRLVLYPLDLAFRQKLNIAHVAEWCSRFSRFTRPNSFSVSRHASFRQFAAKAPLESGQIGLAAICTLQRSELHPLSISAGNRGGAGGCENTGFRAPYRLEEDTLVSTLRDPPHGRRHTLLLARFGGAATLLGERLPNAGAALLASSSSTETFELLPVGGYLGWNDRELKVFLDSRVDIFEYAGVLKDYSKCWECRIPKLFSTSTRFDMCFSPKRDHYVYAGA